MGIPSGFLNSFCGYEGAWKSWLKTKPQCRIRKKDRTDLIMKIPNLEIQRWLIPNKDSEQDSPNIYIMLVNDNEEFSKKIENFSGLFAHLGDRVHSAEDEPDQKIG
jgi:hypothetical protein